MDLIRRFYTDMVGLILVLRLIFELQMHFGLSKEVFMLFPIYEVVGSMERLGMSQELNRISKMFLTILLQRQDILLTEDTQAQIN